MAPGARLSPRPSRGVSAPCLHPPGPALVFSRSPMPSPLSRTLLALRAAVVAAALLYACTRLASPAAWLAISSNLVGAGWRVEAATAAADGARWLGSALAAAAALAALLSACPRLLTSTADAVGAAPWEAVTYAQLHALARRLAACLRAQGVARGATLLVLWPPPSRLELVALLVAVQARNLPRSRITWPASSAPGNLARVSDDLPLDLPLQACGATLVWADPQALGARRWVRCAGSA